MNRFIKLIILLLADTRGVKLTATVRMYEMVDRKNFALKHFSINYFTHKINTLNL